MLQSKQRKIKNKEFFELNFSERGRNGESAASARLQAGATDCRFSMPIGKATHDRRAISAQAC
jgi:hypothetical protein